MTKLKIQEDYIKTLHVDFLIFDMVNDKFVKSFQD